MININQSIQLAISLLFILSIGTQIYIINKLKNVNNDLEIQILNNKILSNLYDKSRTLKHDFANIIQAIGGYIWAKDLPGLKGYYSEILGEFKSINSLDRLSPSLIQNPSIYTIIANKYLLSEDNNIKFNINISSDLNNLKTNPLELVRILGILLDNSIEACLECPENSRIINLSIYELNNAKSISIENSYKNKTLNIDKIYEKNFSTKDRNTGIGLWEVQNYINKDKHLKLNTSMSDSLFKQELLIY